jgi:nucleotide-binding universal stress UspA family protein
MLGSDTRSSLDGAPCAVAVAPHGYAQRAQALDTVGVGYDDSPESKAALELAKQIAAAHGAELLAREVVALPSYSYAGLMTPALGESIDLILEQENQHMRQLPDVEGDAVYGLAGEELAAFGDGLDLLVVGSRGYGPVRRMILGSTSSYLASHARCALLVLPRVAAAPATGADGGRSAAGAMAGTVA